MEREIAPRLAPSSTHHANETLPPHRPVTTPPTGPLTPSSRPDWSTTTTSSALAVDRPPEARRDHEELANHFTTFSQNVLADETDQFLVIDKQSDLAGLPQSLRDAAASAGTTKGHPGKWVITNTRSSVDPFLTYSDRRDLREKAWRMFVDRGDMGGKTDNNATITEILRLRAERAKLLGYPTHAHWRVENTMAKTPERAMELMEGVWKPAVARVHEEVADMQKLANKQGAKLTIEPWDYRYYAEKVRKARYDLDQND